MSLTHLEPGRAFVCLVPQAAGKGLCSWVSSWWWQGWSQPALPGHGPVAGCAGTMAGSLSPGPTFVGVNFTSSAEACCVEAVVRQCQEKTGTVALLGAVSAHWCGAGMLVSWKSWITAPGALWR